MTGWCVVGSNSVEFAPVKTRADHVVGELDRHRLEAEAQSEARHLLLVGVASGRDLALDTSVPVVPAGDHDAVEIAELAGRQQALDALGWIQTISTSAP